MIQHDKRKKRKKKRIFVLCGIELTSMPFREALGQTELFLFLNFVGLLPIVYFWFFSCPVLTVSLAVGISLGDECNFPVVAY